MQFNAIANCNNLIKNIEKTTSEKVIGRKDLYKQLYGEALALRAFLHFDLLRMFHPSYKSNNEYKAIPYIKEFSNKVSNSKPQSTKEILEQILLDLKKSYSLLNKEESSNTDGGEAYTITYYSVAGLLARVYIYKGDKQNALKYAKEVIDSKGFPFVEKNTIINKKDFIFSSEQLFSLYITNKDIKETASSYFPLTNRQDYDASFLFCNKDKIENLYPDKNDIRYKYLFKDVIIEKIKRVVLKKYDSSKKAEEAGGDRIPIIKISEMYLIAAECLTNTNLSEAISYLHTLQNEGRNIKKLPTITDENSLMDEISKEYQREFIGEGQLFYFYKRINKQSLKSYRDNETIIEMNDEKYTFPIPKAESKFGMEK
jgi:hypothetical protein